MRNSINSESKKKKEKERYKDKMMKANFFFLKEARLKYPSKTKQQPKWKKKYFVFLVEMWSARR